MTPTRHTRAMPHPRRSQRPTGVSPLFSPDVVAATGAPLARPLAVRVRPRDLDEFVGQPHLVGSGRVLRRAIDAGQLPSMILWGPPGTGKTTLAAIVARALADPRGLDGKVTVAADALGSLVVVANGDARVALNTLELASDAAAPDPNGIRHVDLAAVKDALQRRSLVYDRAGDSHYDTISAFIKSLRGSDPDAALYWLVRMIDAGEDPMFIARRLVILAAEDVGLADPQALVIAAAAQQAVHLIGLPEGYFPLAEASVYLALAPKSDSIKRAAGALTADIEGTRADPVPLHLRNAVTGLMRGLGYGQGYKYAHDYRGARVEQQHLPDNLAGRRYFEPSEHGYEARIRDYLQAGRDEAGLTPEGGAGRPARATDTPSA